MLTGRETLHNLEKGLGSVKAELGRVDQELEQISQALGANQQKQTQTLQRLAKVRLDEIKSGGLVSALDQADRQTFATLKERETALAGIESSLKQADQMLEQLEQEREEHVQRVEKAGQDVIAAEHDAQSRLEVDENYQAQLQHARKADSIAEEAEQKAELSDQDRLEKGKPFEQDSLFHYLWKRHYGTEKYRANPISRMLDGWVARLCGYEKARVNYWTLLEIPRRLKEHAGDVRQAAEVEVARLQQREQQVAQDIQVPEFQKALEAVELELGRHDKQIADTEDRRDQLLKDRAVYISGQDEYTRKCVQLLAEVMERSDVNELNRTVHLTPSPDDDALARDLLEFREEKNDLQWELEESRRRHDKQLQRLKELEDVRRKFKQHRYDDMRSGFNNGALIASVLSQFLSGVISGTDLWGTMRRHQRHRDVGAWPDFGSGGLGGAVRPRRGGSIWHRPGRRSGGGFRLPRNGGFSSRRRGGGFRTGGGF